MSSPNSATRTERCAMHAVRTSSSRNGRILLRCAPLAGSAAGLAEGFWGSRSAGCENDVGCCLGVGSPRGMDGERARPCAGAKPVADELAVDREPVASTALVRRPLALGDEWAMRDADGWEIQYGAEVEGEAGALRVVSACGVDQEHIGRLRQGTHGRPRGVTGLAGAAAAAGEADEDSADRRALFEQPRRRLDRGQQFLLLDQLLAR